MTGTDIINLGRDLGVFALAAWFIQLIITKSADRKFEHYKTELDHKTREFQSTLDSKIELYKAELNIQNYKSTQIYQEQLSVIKELHKKLKKLHREMHQMTTMNLVIEDAAKENAARIKQAAESYNDFLLYFEDNLIFLPEATALKIDKIRTDYFTSFTDYTFGENFGLKDKETFKMAMEAGKRIRDIILPAINQLANDFRAMIGLTDGEKATEEKGSRQQKD